MKLNLYLNGTKKPDETLNARYERFGKRLGVSLHCVRKWLSGERRINDKHKMAIERLTSGLVSIDEMVRS